ncbi:hypothetical protein J6TS7_29080 [Paenibacillus dendritiformis]|uniref:hypothetical protein n=1 Tax=Paenibacillus TaxID=44249 RepID=UPI001B248A8E|nr:hypothetical protein [Paenibacillus dendritiformis]GIO79298.1 hypothetical protein J6TS7_29080 [Paenibacillus dendritiformis]
MQFKYFLRVIPLGITALLLGSEPIWEQIKKAEEQYFKPFVDKFNDTRHEIEPTK